MRPALEHCSQDLSFPWLLLAWAIVAIAIAPIVPIATMTVSLFCFSCLLSVKYLAILPMSEINLWHPLTSRYTDFHSSESKWVNLEFPMKGSEAQTLQSAILRLCGWKSLLHYANKSWIVLCQSIFFTAAAVLAGLIVMVGLAKGVDFSRFWLQWDVLFIQCLNKGIWNQV